MIAMQDIQRHELPEVVNPSLHGGEAGTLKRSALHNCRFTGGVALWILGSVFVAAEIQAFSVNERADLIDESEILAEKLFDRAGRVEAVRQRRFSHPHPQGILS